MMAPLGFAPPDVTRWCQLLKCGRVLDWDITPEVLARIAANHVTPVTVRRDAGDGDSPNVGWVHELRLVTSELWGKVTFIGEGLALAEAEERLIDCCVAVFEVGQKKSNSAACWLRVRQSMIDVLSKGEQLEIKEHCGEAAVVLVDVDGETVARYFVGLEFNLRAGDSITLPGASKTP